MNRLSKHKTIKFLNGFLVSYEIDNLLRHAGFELLDKINTYRKYVLFIIYVPSRFK